MDIKVAKGLAVRIADLLKRYDDYGYKDMLGDYNDSEDIMLEDLVGQLCSKPERVMHEVLNVLEAVIEDYIEVG